MKGTALAPSQHLRSMPGTTGTSRKALAARSLSLLLGATLALSACGSQAPGAAAIVDGSTISDKDVQTVALELNTIAQGQTKLTPSVVLLNLILAPYVLSEAGRTGKTVPDAQARSVIAKVPNPSPATMDFVRMQLAIPNLSTASKTAILAKLAKADVNVNPRYGTFDPARIEMLPSSPNWIKTGTSSGDK